MTGMTPVAYQYGAEITHPAPEGTSNGIFALVVQASGLLIVLMDALRGAFNNSYIPSFVGLAVLLAASGILMFSLKESPKMQSQPQKPPRGEAEGGRAGGPNRCPDLRPSQKPFLRPTRVHGAGLYMVHVTQ